MCDFDGAILTGCKIDGALFSDSHFTKATYGISASEFRRRGARYVSTTLDPRVKGGYVRRSCKNECVGTLAYVGRMWDYFAYRCPVCNEDVWFSVGSNDGEVKEVDVPNSVWLYLGGGCVAVGLALIGLYCGPYSEPVNREVLSMLCFGVTISFSLNKLQMRREVRLLDVLIVVAVSVVVGLLSFVVFGAGEA